MSGEGMRVKLRETSEGRLALYADQCEACDSVFEMDSYHSTRVGIIRGTFALPAGRMVDANGGLLSLNFRATVCSLLCAAKLFGGGWAKLDRYADMRARGAHLDYCKVEVTSEVKSQKDLIDAWENQGRTSLDNREYVTTPTVGMGVFLPDGSPWEFVSVVGDRLLWSREKVNNTNETNPSHPSGTGV